MASQETHPLPAARLRPLLLLVAVAACVRLLAWYELRDSALLYLERWNGSEQQYVDTWARTVAGGDLMLETALAPPDARFVCDPHPAGEPRPARCSDAPSAAALQRWTRTPAYWNAPLYPYLVGATYALAGRAPRLVLVLQTALGILSCLLAYAIAARLFGDTAALAAGLFAALLGTGLHYETLLADGACSAAASLATVWLLLRALESARPLRAGAAAGMAAAVAALLSAPAALAAAVTSAIAVAVRAAGAEPGRRAHTARFVVGLLCGASMAACPLVARNLVVGAPPFAIAARASLDFVMGNAAGATATAHARASEATAAIFAAPDRGGLDGTARLVAATVATHPTVLEWVALVAAKFAGFWRWYEIPRDANYYYFLGHLPAASRLLIGWPLLAGFSALGLAAAVGKSKAVWLPLAWIASVAVACALLFNLSLLRFPAALVAAPLAGRGVAALLELDRQRRHGRVLLAVVLVAVVDQLTLAPWQVPFGRIAPQYYDVTNHLALELAREQEARGHPERALATLRKQTRAEPRALRNVPEGAELALDPWVALNARGFATVYREQARYAAMLGDEDRARRCTAHAERLGAVVEQWESWPEQ